MKIQYETTGGHIRTFEAEYIGRNKSNTALLYKSADGKKTYEWQWFDGLVGWAGPGLTNPIFRDDVIRVTSNRSCSRFMGYHAKRVQQ